MPSKFITFSLLLSLLLSACTQQKHPAKIGESAPTYTFSNLLNSEQSSIELSDLEGKVTILEFWATWCGPCIPAMQKIDSLKAKFGDQLAVIAISSETTERLNKYLESTQSLLILASDTSHQEIFKYKVIPHSILIDKTGVVRAITNPENITAEVIEDLLAGREIDLPIKDDFYIDPSLKTKTLANSINPDYRIELKNYDQEKRGGSRRLMSAEGIENGVEMWNSTIPRMYQTLFQVASPSRIVFKDSLTSDDFPYEPDHQYNFTIEASEKLEKDWRNLGASFLNDYFDTNGRLGVDTLECFVLTDEDAIIEESDVDETYFTFRGTILEAKKIKMGRLAEYLENFTAFPVVDQTELNGFYDINLEWQAENPKTIHDELKKYGLKLKKSEIALPVEVLMIYKK